MPSLHGTHFLWATRKTVWPPDPSLPGNVPYLLVSTHLIVSPFELLFPLLSSLGHLFLSTSIPQHSRQTQSIRLSPDGDLRKASRRKQYLNYMCLCLSSLTTQKTGTSLQTSSLTLFSRGPLPLGQILEQNRMEMLCLNIATQLVPKKQTQLF